MIQAAACACVLALSVAAPAPVSAESDDAATAPWERGVSDADRAEALALFRAGNQLFTKSEYTQAVAEYEKALAHWDHPRIHGNLATALIYLDEPLDAYRHVELALAYGESPFEAHVYQQLVTNRRLLLGQLTTVMVKCEAEGAEVAIDGDVLFVGPGTRKVMVESGAHQLVARKDEYLTFTTKFTAVGGESTTITVVLVPLAEAARYERRWAVWKPWAVVGSGVAVAALGIPLRRASLAARDDYEEEIARTCPTGCTADMISPAVRNLEDRAHTYNRFEVAAYATGGALVLTGAVLTYLNRERRIPAEQVVAEPVVGPDSVGMSLRVSF